jgi:hypothetical protein
MKTVALTLAMFAALAWSGLASNEAKAGDFGFHISGPGYHVDFGRPHYGHRYVGHSVGYLGWGGWNGGHSWHDTSHWDYHPGEWVRHGHHFHYVPGHYDYHTDGHWDHHHW